MEGSENPPLIVTGWTNLTFSLGASYMFAGYQLFITAFFSSKKLITYTTPHHIHPKMSGPRRRSNKTEPQNGLLQSEW